jgi:hypothetical protein
MCIAALFLGVKRSGREANQSSRRGTEVKNVRSNTSNPPISLCCMHGDNFAFINEYSDKFLLLQKSFTSCLGYFEKIHIYRAQTYDDKTPH